MPYWKSRHRDNLKRTNALERKVETIPTVFRALMAAGTPIPILNISSVLVKSWSCTSGSGQWSPDPTRPASATAGVVARKAFNVYFFLPNARLVPVKSNVDGGLRRFTEVVLNEQSREGRGSPKFLRPRVLLLIQRYWG